MGQPWVYRLWMAPFADKKFAPIVAQNDMTRVRRVLDVGCGPGTNSSFFSAYDYLGIDLNPQYIRDAEKRYGNNSGRRRFLAQDAARFVAAPDERFDFVLINSFLHHIDDTTVRSILANIGNLLTEEGHVHILDLVLPETASVPRFLARSDRGDYPRPLERWYEIFSECFQPLHFEPYDVSAFGVPLWKMVYFKGGRKDLTNFSSAD